MASLLSDAQKATINTAFKDLADTFARPITAYQESQKIVLISDPNFNRLRKFNQNSTKTENVVVETTIMARIYYATQQENPIASIGSEPQNKLRISDGMVRIKIHSSDFDFMSKSKRIELDGNLYDVDSVERPHGVFGVEYYTFWLKRAP